MSICPSFCGNGKAIRVPTKTPDQIAISTVYLTDSTTIDMASRMSLFIKLQDKLARVVYLKMASHYLLDVPVRSVAVLHLIS